MPIDSLNDLKNLMASNGVSRLFAKSLAANDNSKNQVYLGGDFSALNIIPHKAIQTDSDSVAGSKRDRAKAKIDFAWVYENAAHSAPHAQLKVKKGSNANYKDLSYSTQHS